MTALRVFVGLLALEHLWFLVLEMLLWTKPLGLRVFHQSEEKALATRVLAANQGLYNGFLAAGLFWGLLAPAPDGVRLLTFFLGCIFVAGVFGGITHSRRIFLIQGLPAVIALVLLQIL